MMSLDEEEAAFFYGKREAYGRILEWCRQHAEKHTLDSAEAFEMVCEECESQIHRLNEMEDAT